MPEKLEVSEGETIQFTATASGINKLHFVYQWRKRDYNNVSSNLSGLNGTVLTISDIKKSNEGQYYCIVTNQWDRSVRSNDIIVTIHGMLACKV